MNKIHWNETEIRKILDKLQKFWRYPFDYEIVMCKGNFSCIVRENSLYFNSENNCLDSAAVIMKLVYTYLIYAKHHVVMRMTQCQGAYGMYQALNMIGKETCQELDFMYIDIEELNRQETELCKTLQEEFQMVYPGDLLFDKQKHGAGFRVKECVQNEIILESESGECLCITSDDVKDYFIVRM